jgi:hypothetical protein
MTRRPIVANLLALCLLVTFAAPAWAAVVTFEVKNADGEPVAGATITIGDTETTTDDSGAAEAELTAEEGTRVEAVVRYQDGVSGREVVVRQSFVVQEGARIAIAAPQLGLPRRPLAPTMPGGLIGATVARQVINDSGLARSRFSNVIEVEMTGTTGGTTTFLNESRDKTPEEIAELNRTEQKNHRFGPAGGAMFVIPLPALGSGSSWSGALRALAGQPDSPRSSSPGGGPWRVYPSASVGASRASVDFESVDLETAANSQSFSGDGMVLSLGVNAVVFPCRSCGWYTDVSYRYARTGTIDMRRTTDLTDLLPAGVAVTRDGGDYRYWSHTTQATVGHAFTRVAPWAGVRATSWRSRLDIDSELDLTGATIVPGTQRLSATNEYDVTLLELIGGLDIRLPRSPVFLRVEGSTDGNNHSFGFGVGVSFAR